MNPEHVRVLVARRMQQATEALEDGRYLLAAGRGARTAVNRAYYAAFYAVLALLHIFLATLAPYGRSAGFSSNRMRKPACRK
jgi:hypothetical protein